MSDRIFGLVTIIVALAYFASATQIETTFLTDPVGPKAFPMLVGGIAVLCSLFVVLRPDKEPAWPDVWTFVRIGVAVIVLAAYAYALRPLGFIVPTAIAAGIISYQIHANARLAAATGAGLSVGLFLVFKYALGLGLFAFPRALVG